MSVQTRVRKHAPRVHVHTHNASEREYWARELNCTAAELEAAVFAVGTPLEEVREHLARKRAKQCRTPERRRSFTAHHSHTAM